MRIEIKIQNLINSLDKIVITPLSITIKSNDVTRVIGSDSAGKTTLLRMLAKLLSPSHGQTMVAELNPSQEYEKL